MSEPLVKLTGKYPYSSIEIVSGILQPASCLGNPRIQAVDVSASQNRKRADYEHQDEHAMAFRVFWNLEMAVICRVLVVLVIALLPAVVKAQTCTRVYCCTAGSCDSFGCNNQTLGFYINDTARGTTHVFVPVDQFELAWEQDHRQLVAATPPPKQAQ